MEAGTTAPRDWRVTLIRAVVRLPVLRSSRVRQAVLRKHRARQRARRFAAEARGDWSRSRPALYEMDAKIDRYLPHDGGFYVEAGGNDGFRQSNTYHLARRRGWTGLLVEPVPAMCHEARLERPESTVVNCALVADGYAEATVPIRFGGLMSVVAGARGGDDADRRWTEQGLALGSLGLEDEYEVDVPARTLSAVLDECSAPEVDLLSLDVEGYEPEVLAGLDFARHAPRYVLVEVRDGAALDVVKERLGDRYDLVEMFSEWDAFFARRS